MWKTTASKIVYETDWLRLREDQVEIPTDEKLVYTYVDHAGAVFVVPFTQEGRVILIRSYRQTLGLWCWEVPAGSLATETSTSSLDEIAYKELREEIGALEADLLHLGSYYLAKGIAKLKGDVFLASNVTYSADLDLEPGELIDEVKEFSVAEVEEMILSGDIIDADSSFALMLAFMHRREKQCK